MEVDEKTFIGTKGYNLYRYSSEQDKYDKIATVKDPKYSLFSYCSLSRRLLRTEITNLYKLPNGDRLAIAKKGIFRLPADETTFIKCFSVPRGSRPLNLCITPDGHIYFGEYFVNTTKQSVHIYHSEDYGKSWNIVYTFEDGNINHIHGIFWDPYAHRIWVATGDRDNECIIAYTSDGFKTLNIVLRGGQEYRTTNLFFYKDFIVYATDSQYMINEIRKIDRKTLAVETLQKIQGTAIKGGQKGDCVYLSTTVEPSEINKDNYSHLWISRNGMEWREIYKAEKDILPSIFQFGSIEFPQYTSEIKDSLMFYGRALKGIGGDSVKISI